MVYQDLKETQESLVNQEFQVLFIDWCWMSFSSPCSLITIFFFFLLFIISYLLYIMLDQGWSKFFPWQNLPLVEGSQYNYSIKHEWFIYNWNIAHKLYVIIFQYIVDNHHKIYWHWNSMWGLHVDKIFFRPKNWLWG